MRAKDQVIVNVDGNETVGLLLSWGRRSDRALVTFEVDGRVATMWIPAEQLRALPELPHAQEPALE